MSLFKKAKKYITNPAKLVIRMGRNSFLKKMSDEKYLKLFFKERFGYALDLENPKTFNEKLQWLKLYDRKPIYSTMVDKYEVKKYVADAIGEEYIIPTLGVWDNFDEIDFDALPEQFVLKCTHDSGGLIICRDKNSLDKDAAKEKIDRCLKRNYYWHGREWPYKNVRPRIIAEKYMEDSATQELRDYKFFCFSGEMKVMFIASERYNEKTETRFDFFDRQFQHLDFRNGHPNADIPPAKPEKFEEMCVLAEKLARDIPLLRVDFYEVNGEIYFGELTFSHWSGMMPFEPKKWDEKLGDWIKLPDKQVQ